MNGQTPDRCFTLFAVDTASVIINLYNNTDDSGLVLSWIKVTVAGYKCTLIGYGWTLGRDQPNVAKRRPGYEN